MSDAKPVMPRWASLYLSPVVAFCILAYYTDDKALILVLNIVLAFFATTIVVSFTQEQWNIATSRGPMSRGAWFAYGIWWSWGAVDFRVAESVVWRYLGQPEWLINSDITNVGLFASCVGAIGHIVRPGDLADRLPQREVLKVALLTGTAVAVALTYLLWPDIVAAWRHQRAVWLDTPGIESAVAGPPPKGYCAKGDLACIAKRDVRAEPPDYRTAADVPKAIKRAIAEDAPAAASPTTRRIVIDPDALADDAGQDTPVGEMPRVEARVTPSLKARVEQSRVANGDRSIAAAVRRLLGRALGDEDRDALGVYEPGRR